MPQPEPFPMEERKPNMHVPYPCEVNRSRTRMRTLDRMSRLLSGFVLLVLASPAAPLWAQSEDLDDPRRAAEYRAQKEAATKTFLDAEAPKQARLEAATKLGYPEEETFHAMLRIGADTMADDEIRWQAMRQHRFDENYLDAVLDILEDPQDGGGKLVGDLVENLSRRTTFRLPAPLEQRIRAALRDLLDDSREQVRLAGYRSLVSAHDTVAVNRLVQALNDKDRQVPIPLHEAISLLDLDGSIYHIRTLQPYLDHKDSRVQAQAARALAVDPSRRPQIVDLALDQTTPEEVRLHALRALAREDEAFSRYAIELVADGGESAAVRYAAMKHLAGRMNYREVEADHQIRFAEVVEQLPEDSTLEGKSGEELQREATKLLAYLQQAFPAVELHYALR